MTLRACLGLTQLSQVLYLILAFRLSASLRDQKTCRSDILCRDTDTLSTEGDGGQGYVSARNIGVSRWFRWKTTTLVSPPTHVFSGHTTDLPRSICVPRSRNLYRYLLLQLSRFDDACRFRIRLARTSLYSELDKWCFCHHARKLVQESTL